MTDEEFVLAIIAMVGITTVISIFLLSIFGYARARLKRKEQARSSGSSLTTSELHGIMRSAVEEATTPLVERIAALEQRLDGSSEAPRLAPRRPDELIDSLDAAAEAEAEPARRSRRR